jgi:hypothetical protein
MSKKFKVGDHVSWNSEAGRVSGRVVRVHTRDVNYKGYPITRARMIRSTRSKATKPITSLFTRVEHCGICGADGLWSDSGKDRHSGMPGGAPTHALRRGRP